MHATTAQLLLKQRISPFHSELGMRKLVDPQRGNMGATTSTVLAIADHPLFAQTEGQTDSCLHV